MISKWKTAALQAMPAAFDEDGSMQRRLQRLQAEHEREKEALYAEIGRLTTQVNWLQKNYQKARNAAVPLGRADERACVALAKSIDAGQISNLVVPWLGSPAKRGASRSNTFITDWWDFFSIPPFCTVGQTGTAWS